MLLICLQYIFDELDDLLKLHFFVFIVNCLTIAARFPSTYTLQVIQQFYIIETNGKYDRLWCYGFNKKYIEFCKPDHNIQKYITKAHFQHKISRFYLKYTSWENFLQICVSTTSHYNTIRQKCVPNTFLSHVVKNESMLNIIAFYCGF